MIYRFNQMKLRSKSIGLISLLFVSSQAWTADQLLIVGGLGGDPDFQLAFDEQADEIYQSALNLGLREDQVRLLNGLDATKENILAAIASIRADSDDFVQLHLIGHGSFDGNNYKFNIPGPDITAQELSEALNNVRGDQLIALMTSASGGAMDILKADNRLVITATRTGLQKNASVFSRYWAEGAKLSTADLNKNEIISAAELYAYTSERVTSYYESEGLIASEASLYEVGESVDPDLFNISRIGQLASSTLSPEAEALIAERANVEVRLSELSGRRQELTEDQYFAELQDLMLELGLLQQRIDREIEAGSE